MNQKLLSSRNSRMIMFLFVYLSSCMFALADNTVKGSAEHAPLKVKYAFSGGDIKPEITTQRRHTYTATVHPGEIISAYLEMTEGAYDGNSEKSSNHLYLSISTDSKTIYEKNVDSGSLPTQATEYVVKESDRNITVYGFASTEWSTHIGSASSALTFEVNYTVVSGSTSSAANEQSSLADQPEEEKEDVCPTCGLEKLSYVLEDFYGGVHIGCDQLIPIEYEFAQLNNKLYNHDVIIVDEESEALLRFTDMNRYFLKAGTTVRLVEEPDESNFTIKMRLLKGVMWGNIQNIMKNQAVGFEMAHCVAGIKGTIFALQETGTESRAWLFTSRMEVRSKKTGEVIDLKPGQQAVVGKDGEIHVSEFDIEEMAEEFGIPMEQIRERNGGHTPLDFSSIIFYVLLAVAAITLIAVIVLLCTRMAKTPKAIVSVLLLLLAAALVSVAFLMFRPQSLDKQTKDTGMTLSRPADKQDEDSDEEVYHDVESVDDLDGIDGIVDVNDDAIYDDDQTFYEAMYQGRWISEGAYICQEREVTGLSDYDVAMLIEDRMEKGNFVKMKLANGKISIKINNRESLSGNYRIQDNGYLVISGTNGSSETMWMYPGVDNIVYCYLSYTDDDGSRMASCIKLRREI